MHDKWNIDSLKSDISLLLTDELRGLLNEDEINVIINNSGSDIRKAINAIDNVKKRGTKKKALTLGFIKELFPKEVDNDMATKILECISMFNIVGYNDIYSNQSDILCSEWINCSREDFDKIIKVLITNNFIEQSGSFIWVSAFQIDFILHFLRKNDSESLNKFITVLEKTDLGRSFGKQIMKIADYEDSTKIKELIAGENGLITRIEFINSRTGSEIINNLVEINPIDTSIAILGTVSKQKLEDLQNLKIGRRNLVWALEKLAFRKETFSNAADTLLLLSIAENETIGNNSTSQLVELFQILLAGTQATLDERFAWITKQFPNTLNQSILISCLDRGLMTRNFVKMKGAEKQAGEELQEAYPQKEEIKKYWYNIIEFLKKIATDNSNPNSTKASQVLINRFNQQLLDGLADEIISAIEILIIQLNYIPKDLNQQFAHALSLDWNISQEHKTRILLILEKHKPTDIKSQLENIIKLPPYKIERINNETKDLSEVQARELIKKWTFEDDLNWLDHIDILLEGEQRQAFAFGNELGKISSHLGKIISRIIEAYSKISFDNRNTALLEGIIAGKSDETFTRLIIDELLKKTDVAYHAIRLNRFLKINFTDVSKLFQVIYENPNYVIAFQYMDFSNLSNEELFIVISELLKAKEFGHAISTGIVGEVIRKNPTRSDEIITTINKVLFHKDVLKFNNQNFFLLMHYFDLAEKRLNQNDINLAKFLSNEIIEVCKEFTVPNETYVVRLLRMILDKYWVETWDIVGGKIISDSYEGWWNLKAMLEKYDFKNETELITWITNNMPLSARNIIQFIRFEQKKENDTDDWTPIMYNLIEIAGDDEYFLNTLSARLHSYFTSGSTIPIFTSRIILLQKLHNHPIEKIRLFSEKEILSFEKAISEEKKWIENYHLRNKS